MSPFDPWYVMDRREYVYRDWIIWVRTRYQNGEIHWWKQRFYV